jgi:hypothetical protein
MEALIRVMDLTEMVMGSPRLLVLVEEVIVEEVMQEVAVAEVVLRPVVAVAEAQARMVHNPKAFWRQAEVRYLPEAMVEMVAVVALVLVHMM